MTTAYPLAWPEGWKRTKNPAKSQFKTTLNGAIGNVQDSIRRFSSDSGHKVENVLVSSNVTLMDAKPSDAGVAVYFTWDGISTCIAVDRYQKVEENLQAIHHVLEAERTKLRHGGLNLVRHAFRGYAALPPPGTASQRPWHDVLGVYADASLAACKAAYQAKAKELHPDRGGSEAAMAELNAAMEEAKRARG